MSKRISFQGVDGAYSQLAVKDFFSGAETLPCKTFEIALNEAELGNVDYAMIPIENSAAGRVADIHRLIPKSNLHINLIVILIIYITIIHFSDSTYFIM